MKRRLFVAINLPDAVRRSIERIVGLFKSEFLNYRFLDSRNWHITLIFLGDQDEDILSKTIDVVDGVISSFSLPEMKFNRIVFGPDENHPRMIWISGSAETSEELGGINEELKHHLGEADLGFENSPKKFQAHITIARLKKSMKGGGPPIKLPTLSLSFDADSAELMESNLVSSGPEYTVLSSHKFKEF
jgi:RNA 2',3'-cyclic 3'-phosphodiesterase